MRWSSTLVVVVVVVVVVLASDTFLDCDVFGCNGNEFDRCGAPNGRDIDEGRCAGRVGGVLTFDGFGRFRFTG
jgi:hypothetical protein